MLLAISELVLISGTFKDSMMTAFARNELISNELANPDSTNAEVMSANSALKELTNPV